MRKPHSGQRPPGRGGPGGKSRPEERGGKLRLEERPSGARPKRTRPRKERPAGSLPSGARPGAGGQPAPEPKPLNEPMRIAKAMARAGLCSRREAERWIADGRVAVNGKVLQTPACEVGPGDKILVDGRPLPAAEPVRLWRFHKPKGLVTTHQDPQGRPTVFEKLPPEMPRVISIGRLDFNTEGLLLLTNDGALARHLELPATGWLRRYRVRARGRVTQADLDKLKDGIEIEGVRYGPIEATIDTVQGANAWLTVGIREGKNREVRKVMSSLGLEVSRLIRISFGPFELADLVPGAVEVVRRKHLAEQLGPTLAGEFGLTETPEQRKERHARGRQKGTEREDET
jgi:23S rRNA pseudouridine2605 synthase